MKKIIALSAIAFLSTSVFAAADADARIAKLEKKLAKLSAKVSKVNAQAAKDNIKFDVDFRTSLDQLNYKTLGGEELKNDGLLSNRLWLNMGYAPTDNMVFKGQLAYHKAFGNSAMRADGYPQRGMGFDTFDWVSSETLSDDKVRVREAYWLYTDKIGGLDVTASIGRRPSTNGYLANLRDDDAKPKSPLGHVINMEFDGASASVKSDAILPGLMFKLCVGRGLTNTKSWANQADSTMANGMGATSPDYVVDKDAAMDTVDMAGFIFVPYDDGQYALKTTWYRGLNVPGMRGNMTLDNNGTNFLLNNETWNMESTGSIDGMAASFKVDGIGDGISDFLDETTFFASYAMSVSHPEDARDSEMIEYSAAAQTAMGAMANSLDPNMVAAYNQMMSMMGVMNTGTMMGSNEDETGTSIWIGTQMPNGTGGRFGLEYNKGSQYWRPFTYGEDTLAGSKLATRGTAIEAYWTQPLIKDVFSMQVRYTQMNYDYTGSNGFFGDGGASYSMDEAATINQLFGMLGGGFDPVESASDLRVNFRYRY